VTTGERDAWGTYNVLTGRPTAAIAVVRIRGPRAAAFITGHTGIRNVDALATRRVRRATLRDDDGAPLDDILVTVHAPPPRFDAQLHLHGNPHLVDHVAGLLERAGLAADTSPSGLWPATDQIEADALELLPRILSERGVTWLLDQASALRGRIAALCASPDNAEASDACRALIAGAERVAWFTTPLRVALLGPPNAGKSTLVNALADRCASVVSATPGTTRDWVEIATAIDGLPVTWLDTAGLRESGDALESAAAARSRAVAEAADAVVIVLAADAPRDAAEFVAAYSGRPPAVVVINKTDRAAPGAVTASIPESWRSDVLATVAAEGRGVAAVAARIRDATQRTDAKLAAISAFTADQTAALEAAADTRDRDERDRIIRRIIGRPEVPAAGRDVGLNNKRNGR
jgi:tRNA modification GTPase